MTAIVGLLCCCDGGGGGGCENCEPVKITWSGSCVWTGICCPYDAGGIPPVTGAFNRYSYSGTLAGVESPFFTETCNVSEVRFSEYELLEVGGSCGSDFWLFDPSDITIPFNSGIRIRFFLQGSGGAGWQITVSPSGFAANGAPNEAGINGPWSLVFTAPAGSECPPASGWTYQPDLSVEPLVMTPECESATGATDVFVTSFTVGSVTVAT